MNNQDAKTLITKNKESLDMAGDMVKALEEHLRSFLPNPEKTTVVMWMPDSEMGTAGLKFIFSTV